VNQRNSLPWLIPLLAALAIWLPNRATLAPAPPGVVAIAPPGEPPPPIKEAASQRPKSQGNSSATSSTDLLYYRGSPIELLWQYFNSQKDEGGTDKTSVDLSFKGTDISGQLSLAGKANNGSNDGKLEKFYWDGVTSHLQQFLAQKVPESSLKVIVAAVADPTRSHLEYDTEREIDAIQRAAEASHGRYVLDRYSLPWSPAATSTSTGQATDQGDATSVPGALLLRSTVTNAHDLLLVLLVGETPTAGVHKVALIRAIALALALAPQNLDLVAKKLNFPGAASSHSRKHNHITPAEQCDVRSHLTHCYLNPDDNDVSGKCDCAKPQTVRILGPHFTGALSSYENVFDEWKGKDKQKKEKVSFSLLSGSATALRADELNPLRDRVCFRATVWPDAPAMDELVAYLKANFGASEEEIALLTETNTGYGNPPFSSPTATPTPAASPGPLGASHPALAAVTTPTAAPTATVYDFLRLPFPLHISRLRSTPVQSGLPSSTTPPPDRSFVPLSLSQQQREDVPPSSSPLERSSNSQAVQSLLATIARQRIRFVMIMATDVDDVIYLALQVESSCPDTTIIVFGSDILFTNPDVATLRGTLVVSTYPLLTYDQDWSSSIASRQRVIQFPSQEAEGFYNATLGLLGDGREMLDYGEPFSEYAGPTTPPLWLTQIGRSEAWPVALLKDGGDRGASEAGYLFNAQTDQSMFASSSAQTPISTSPADRTFSEMRIGATLLPQRGWRLICQLVWALLTYLTLVLMFPEIWVLNDLAFDPPIEGQHALKKGILRGGFRCTLWAGTLLLISVVFFPQAAEHWSSANLNRGGWIFRCAVLIETIGLLGALLAVPIVRFYRGSGFPRANIFAGTFALVATVLIGSLSAETRAYVADLFQTSPSANPHAIVEGFRYANVSSGVSAFMPLVYLTIAGLGWFYCAMRALAVGEWIAADDVRLSTLGLRGWAFPRTLAAERELNQTLFCFDPFAVAIRGFRAMLKSSLEFGIVAIFILLGFLAISGTVFGYPGTEGWWFNWIFFLGFALLSLLFAFGVGHTIVVWHRFRRLLAGFSGHRLFAPPAVIPGITVASLPKLSLTLGVEDLTAKRLAVDALDGVQLGPWRLRSLRAAARLMLTLAEDAQGRGNWFEAAKRAAVLRRYLARISRSLSQGVWLNPATVAEGSGVQPPDQSRELARSYLALRVFDYCQQVAHHLRNLMYFSAAGLVLLLLAVSSYPFQDSDSILRLVWFLILFAVGAWVTILIQMNRDEVLSLFTQGVPGQIDWNRTFVFHLLVLGLLPIIGLLGIQFPATLQGTISWLSSLVQGAR
jgi:hypothetical protein